MRLSITASGAHFVIKSSSLIFTSNNTRKLTFASCDKTHKNHGAFSSHKYQIHRLELQAFNDLLMKKILYLNVINVTRSLSLKSP